MKLPEIFGSFLFTEKNKGTASALFKKSFIPASIVFAFPGNPNFIFNT